MDVLVCFDRDGTLIVDEDSFLGFTQDWAGRVRLRPGVVAGVKLLKAVGVKCFLTTNQSGVALREFPLLTVERAREVNGRVLELLREEHAGLDGALAAVFLPRERAVRYEMEGREVDRAFVREQPADWKPAPGMMVRALRELGWEKGRSLVFVVGDRVSDVLAGIASGGHGVLVPSSKGEREGARAKCEALLGEFPGRVYVARDVFDACQYIVGRVGEAIWPGS